MEGAFKACSRENFLHHCPGMVMVGEFLEMEMGECGPGCADVSHVPSVHQGTHNRNGAARRRWPFIIRGGP